MSSLGIHRSAVSRDGLLLNSELLKQLVAISETLNEGEGQLARANYKLAILYDQNGMAAEGDSCRARAMELRGKLRPEAKDAPFEESEFMKLCLWMLW